MKTGIWPDILAALEQKTSKPNFVTWLKPTQLLEEKNGLFVIGVPNHYTKNWLEQHALNDITQLLTQHYPEVRAVSCVITEPITSLEDLPLLQSFGTQPEESTEPVATESPEDDLAFGLQHRFENFVVGNNNRLAFAAAQVVAEKPGEAYNPLFLYGGVGLGKTHLMQAIGSAIRLNHPKKKIIYTSCETFTSEFIEALRLKEVSSFKKKYRNVDVLLIDDIQFLSNKEGTQEEFFHTFNILHQAKRQIVMTADRLPREIANLEERLTSRFGWGMVADIQSPNYETRVAILQAKAAEQGVAIRPEVMEFIANTTTSNVRELEGSLTRLISTAQLDAVEITLEYAARALKEIIRSSKEKSSVSSKKVIQTVAQYLGVEVMDILGSKRTKEIVYPRQLVMYLLRNELGYSFPQIGDLLGGKDHTTVMHGEGKIAALKKTDDRVEQDLTTLQTLLSS